MPFFDLFGWSRSRRAPTSFHKRVRFTVELLESRLVPSASGWSSPGDTVAPPSEVRLCSVCAPAVMVPAPVSGGLVDVSANGDYTVTVSSDAQDGTGWNGCAPCGGAPASANNATAPSDYFSLTCSSDFQVGQGWAVSALPSIRSAT